MGRAADVLTSVDLDTSTANVGRAGAQVAVVSEMGLRRAVIIAMVLGFATAHTATAQEENRLAIGGSVGHRAAIDADAHGEWTFGLNWRLGHGDSGWGWQAGLG